VPTNLNPCICRWWACRASTSAWDPVILFIVCCSVLQCVAVWCNEVRFVATCCRVLQCVAVCCSVLLQVIRHQTQYPFTKVRSLPNLLHTMTKELTFQNLRSCQSRSPHHPWKVAKGTFITIIYSKLGSVLAFKKFETLIAMPRLPLYKFSKVSSTATFFSQLDSDMYAYIYIYMYVYMCMYTYTRTYRCIFIDT